MSEKEKKATGFAKKTDFTWLGIGLFLFLFLIFIPTPQSMIDQASIVFNNLSIEAQNNTSVDKISFNIQVIIALLSMCVIFFATEDISLQ